LRQPFARQSIPARQLRAPRSIPTFAAQRRIGQLCLAWPKTEHEQCAIAEALSEADALLGGLDRLIAKNRDFKQAAMQQLFTGKTRLPVSTTSGRC
jgi:hypothetical protein